MNATQPRLHIVQMLADLSLGGSQLVAVELAEACADAGHRLTVIAGDGVLSERINRAGAAHLDWPVGKKRLATLKLVRPLRQWIRDEKPDLVHVHSRIPAWVAWLALRKLDESERPAWVTTVHGHYSANPYSAIMAKGDGIIAVSEHIHRYTQNNYSITAPDRITTIHGGTASDEFPYGHRPSEEWQREVYRLFPDLQGKTLLCLPGRITQWKGHLPFLDVFAALAADRPELHAVFVGGGRDGSSYLKAIHQTVEEKRLQGRVTITGMRRDVPDWMAASAIVFNLSNDPPEAFGRTVLEALRLGVPVLAWNHGGAAEILAEMFPAGAVEPDNTEQMIARAETFLDQPPEVAESRAFTLKASMQKHLELYQSLVAER